jgi:hypothetical protein
VQEKQCLALAIASSEPSGVQQVLDLLVSILPLSDEWSQGHAKTKAETTFAAAASNWDLATHTIALIRQSSLSVPWHLMSVSGEDRLSARDICKLSVVLYRTLLRARFTLFAARIFMAFPSMANEKCSICPVFNH